MPVHYPHRAGETYRPSNGTEGEMFMDQYCYGCSKDLDEDNPCPILTAAIACYSTDEGYPPEWIYDRSGRPTCTAFSPATEDDGLEKSNRCPDTLDMFEKEASDVQEATRSKRG